MLIKGEKYACEACVRGHRVSNCQHSDRPLQHINKKGRPVSQCQHCRTLRKSRASHVRCDCGEKSHAKGSSCGHEGEPQDDNKCGCCHGQRCSCSVKKEHLDPVPESDSDEHPVAALPTAGKRRARALTVQSEGSGLTVFTNGHHKPVHKHNNMAHKCGLPYVVPRAHSIHGQPPASLANRSVDNLLHTNTIDALHSGSHIKDSMVSAKQEQRMVKSEHGSPIINPVSNLDDLNGMLPPLDLTNIPGDYNFMANLDSFPTMPDLDQPLFSAGLSAASIDWSHYDGLDFNNTTGNFAASYSQAPSFTGFDFGSIDQPALTTTSTSGEISEVEDFAPRGDQMPIRPSLQRRYGSDFDTSDVGDGYRLSTASSYVGLPQTSMLAGNSIDSLDIDAFLKGVSQPSFSNFQDGAIGYADNSKSVPNMSLFDGADFSTLPADEDNDAFWMSGFTSGQLPVGNESSDIPDGNLWAQ